ncbi:aldose epimerase family protein [Ahrensia kielensis]|uniref:Aldose 1-epimerase n=1 Tax=Ahrensia kielensis TaxID=76980 RepID=A0ABU9T2P9_9HYPH
MIGNNMNAFGLISLDSEHLHVVVMPFGATLVDMRVKGRDAPLILGWNNPKDYAVHSGVFAGAVVGRYANRIALGKTQVDGRDLTLETNSAPHHSHGGSNGFSSQSWRVGNKSASSVEFLLQSPDGAGGYPGELNVRATYEIVDEYILRLTFTATTSKTTLLNMCHHPYFNLKGHGDTNDHILEIAAEHYLPHDGSVLPTGEISPVASTPFDFMHPRQIADAKQSTPYLYNHTYALARKSRETPHFAARLSAPDSPTMEVWTTQTGLHFYNGYKIPTVGGGLDGQSYGPYSGLCLEAQNWPDAPNNVSFPSAKLTPDMSYKEITEYKLY